jgi:ATP-dependent DNA helicase RecG
VENASASSLAGVPWRTWPTRSRVTPITIDGPEAAAVITVRVEASPIKPVWAFGRPYKRMGRTNQRLSREETQRLAEVTTGRTWDALPCFGLRLEDIDRARVEAFLRQAGLTVGTGTEQVLRNLRLIGPEGLCNAAALLFTDFPQRFVIGSQVKCGRFLGVDAVQFLDEQTLDGDVLSQIDRAMAFVARNTRQGIRFTGRPEREIVPEYPTDAVREAIINAVCHRDYAAAGTVQVRIHDDRLEVWNPGTLPPGITLEDLYRVHPSHPRNRLLAGAFYRARLIEHWGTGTLRIIRECEAAGLPRPEFIIAMGGFIVRFRTGDVEAERPRLRLSERQGRAIAYVRAQGSISQSQYRALVGLGTSQAKEDLAELVQARLLARSGSGRATVYVLASDSGHD